MERGAKKEGMGDGEKADAIAAYEWGRRPSKMAKLTDRKSVV